MNRTLLLWLLTWLLCTGAQAADLQGRALAATLGSHLLVADEAGTLLAWDLSADRPMPFSFPQNAANEVGRNAPSTCQALIATTDRFLCADESLLWSLMPDTRNRHMLVALESQRFRSDALWSGPLPWAPAGDSLRELQLAPGVDGGAAAQPGRHTLGARGWRSMDLHPGGRWLVAAGANGAVNIHDAEGAVWADLRVHERRDKDGTDPAVPNTNPPQEVSPAELAGAWFLGEDGLLVALQSGSLRFFHLLDPDFPLPLLAADWSWGTLRCAPAILPGEGTALLLPENEGFPRILWHNQRTVGLTDLPTTTAAAVVDPLTPRGFILVDRGGRLDRYSPPAAPPLDDHFADRQLLRESRWQEAASWWRQQGVAAMRAALLQRDPASDGPSLSPPDPDAVLNIGINHVAVALPVGVAESPNLTTPDSMAYKEELVSIYLEQARSHPFGAMNTLRLARVHLDDVVSVAPWSQTMVEHRRSLDLLERRSSIMFLCMLALLVVLVLTVTFIFLRGQWQSRMRDRLLELKHNPFRVDSPHRGGGSVFAAHGFTREVLRSLGRNNMVVLSSDEAGRAAFLRHVARQIRRTGIHERDAIVVELDLLDMQEEAFWTVLAKRLLAATQVGGDDARPLQKSVVNQPDVVRFCKRWPALEQRTRGEARPFLLVVDHLGVMGHWHRQNNRFRNLLQLIPASTLTIIGGARSLVVADTEFASPWHNYLLVHRLRPFTLLEVEAYLASRLANPYTMAEDVPHLLLELTGGQPQQIWHFAFRMVEEAREQRTTDISAAHVLMARQSAESVARSVLGLETTDSEIDLYPKVIERINALRRRRDTLMAASTNTRIDEDAWMAQGDPPP